MHQCVCVCAILGSHGISEIVAKFALQNCLLFDLTLLILILKELTDLSVFYSSGQSKTYFALNVNTNFKLPFPVSYG